MRQKISRAIILIGCLFTVIHAYGGEAAEVVADKDVCRLEVQLEKEKATVGERLIYEVLLVSETPDIDGYGVIRRPDFGSLPKGQVASDSRIDKSEVKGSPRYSVVIDRYFVGAEGKGTKNLKGGRYEIAVNQPKIINHPFHGRVRVDDVKVLTLDAPDVQLKITPLPAKGKPEDFSGGVGKFEIETELPSKEIHEGEESIFIVKISGQGDLSNVPAPDVMQAFREGLHFRNMTDSKDFYVAKGSLGSEMQLECRFTADKPGHYRILPIRFSFFDPERKRYTTIETPVMEIEVLPKKETTRKPPVFHNI